MQRVGKYCMGEYPPPPSGLLPGFADGPEGRTSYYHVQRETQKVLSDFLQMHMHTHTVITIP